MENIEVGKVYYFNNREILILRKDTENMFLVCGDFDINHDVTGSCWCTQCQVGGHSTGYLGEHTCYNVQEIIDEVMDNISHYNVFWVARQYIQEKPFEYKKHVELIEANDAIQSKIDAAKSELANCQELITTENKSLGELAYRKSELERELSSINSEIEIANDRKAKVMIDTEDVVVSVGNIKLSASELLELLQCRIRLRLLEQGGVDNWEWYGESIGDADIDALAIEELANL